MPTVREWQEYDTQIKSRMFAHLSKLPSCPFEQRGWLPDVSALYFVSTADECLYVGQSLHLRQRWQNHEKTVIITKEYDAAALRIAWLPVPEKHLLCCERTAIERLTPKFNIALVPISKTTVRATLRRVDVVFLEIYAADKGIDFSNAIAQAVNALWESLDDEETDKYHEAILNTEVSA